MTNLAQAAEQAFGWLTWKTKKKDGEDINDRIVTQVGCPQWVITVIREAHGDFLPDNWRYIFIYEALQALHENDGDEDVARDAYDMDEEVYTSNLLEWVSSNLQRVGYCDDTFDTYGPPSNLVELLQRGRRDERLEVFDQVTLGLERHFPGGEEQDA